MNVKTCTSHSFSLSTLFNIKWHANKAIVNFVYTHTHTNIRNKNLMILLLVVVLHKNDFIDGFVVQHMFSHITHTSDMYACIQIARIAKQTATTIKCAKTMKNATENVLFERATFSVQTSFDTNELFVHN